MFTHILVPTDGSKLSDKAVKTALELAKSTGARITAFHVNAPYTPPPGDGMMYYVEGYSPKDWDAWNAKSAKAILAKAQKAAEKAGVRCDALTKVDAQPWKAIVAAARSRKCDLVVMASHGRRGLAGVLLGSETTKVLTHSKVPVLVCR